MRVSAQAAQNYVPASVQVDAPISLARTDLCIVYDGDVSLAAASILMAGGNSVRLWVPASYHLETLPAEFEMRQRGATVGSVRGKTSFQIVSDEVSVALTGADGIIITRPVNEYSAIIEKLMPHLTDRQTVCLTNAPLGAGLQFGQLLHAVDSQLQVNLLEMSTLFDYAKIEDNVLLITGMRDKVSFCGNTRNETRRGLAIANAMSSGLVPTSNVLERGFSEVEHVLRPLFLLFGLLGGHRKGFEDVSRFVNRSLTSVIKAVDGEIRELGKNFGCVVPEFFETMTHFSGIGYDDADCLDQALIIIGETLLEQAMAEHKGNLSIRAGLNILKLEAQATFVLLSDFARLSRQPMPVMNSMIELASVVTKTDLVKSGRRLQDLGLMGLEVEEIIELVNA